ncbi:hypothetical protein [Desulfobacter postgatei]|jgi:hypothetical protein|uniref:hypothetical protein n=1 Tax=Desulfobacter postgatei TaxID=2293 RepID=UPI002A367BBA|nr:hypothetical protein [Desulfobacter postgatei]MDX9964268.1 hypothetical protein [Desulfobacter postgatei]
MTNIELSVVKKVFRNADDVQDFFDNILKATLTYKFKKTHSGSSGVLINGKDLTEAIFKLTVKDKLEIYGQTINGLRVKELFISTIYLRYLVATLEKEFILVAFPFQEEYYDIAFFTVKEKNYTVSDNKFHIPIDSAAHYVQIKENFDYEEYNKFNEADEPKKFDSKKIENTTSRYNNVLILFFSRNHSLFESENIESFLEKNKNVGIIIMPSPAIPEIEFTGGRDKGKKILLEKDTYNFLLETGNGMAHIKFKVPKFLIKLN